MMILKKILKKILNDDTKTYQKRFLRDGNKEFRNDGTKKVP